MRDYVLEKYPEKTTWSLRPYSATPFFPDAQGWSRDFQPASHADFTFLATTEKVTQRSLSGAMVFKASDGKTAEALFREFIGFCSEGEFSREDSDVFSERSDFAPSATSPDAFAACFPATFQSLRIKSFRKGMGERYAYCHLSAINQIGKRGAHLVAQVTFSLDSLWYEHHEIAIVGSTVGYGTTTLIEPGVRRYDGKRTVAITPDSPNGKDAQSFSTSGDVPASVGIIASGYIATVSATKTEKNSTWKQLGKDLLLSLPDGGYESSFLCLGRIGNKTIGYFQQGTDAPKAAVTYMTLDSAHGPSFSIRPGETCRAFVAVSSRVPTTSVAAAKNTCLTVFWEDAYFNE